MSFIKVANSDAHLEWQIARPERANALGTTIASDLASLMTELQGQLTSGRALPRSLTLSAITLVKGAQRLWIAGGDLKELALLKTVEAGLTYAATMSRFCQELSDLPLPVIAAVDGAAIGGGAELCLAADLRVATAASRFDFKQLRIGLATGYGSCRRLVDLVGLSRAQELLLTGREVGAAEALEIGLIHKLAVDPEELATIVTAWRQAFNNFDPAALAAQKTMLHNAVELHPGATRAAELQLFRNLWMQPAHAQALEQFLGKKP